MTPSDTRPPPHSPLPLEPASPLVSPHGNNDRAPSRSVCIGTLAASPGVQAAPWCLQARTPRQAPRGAAADDEASTSPTPTPYLLRRITPCSRRGLRRASIPGRAAQVWTALASENPPCDHCPASTRARTSPQRARKFEAFQIVVTGEAGNVRATASELSGPSTLGGIRLYRAALIQVQTASALDGATGPWPDALVRTDEHANERRSAFPFAVPPGESRAIWVEVFVPPEAPAGEYTAASP